MFIVVRLLVIFGSHIEDLLLEYFFMGVYYE